MTNRTCSLPGCERRHIARGYCSTHYNRLVLGEAKRHPKQTVSCTICGAQVRRRRDSRYRPTCSTTCRAILTFGAHLAPASGYEWKADAVQRARKHGAYVVEAFDRVTIFERDEWTCRLCGIQCNQPDPYDRTAATVDHIVPLHLGGEHSRANAQTLCLSCNSRKADALDRAA